MPEWDRLSDMTVEDLHANSTAYDIATAAPSDDVLRLQFTLLATVNAVVATSCLFLLVSMLRSPKVREQSFNLYLVAITFPDFVMSFMCLLTCAMSASSATYFSESMCGFQSWYLVWAIASNCWVNAVISHQVHKMLKISHNRGRYNPPTRTYVMKQAGCVYVYAAFLASISAWAIPGVPLESGSYRGFVCFPKTYDTASTIVFWLVFCPLYLFIPAFYVLWCAADIWRKKMIPPVGRRRALAIYFLRIVFVFIIMWFPYFILAFIIGPSLPSLEAAWVIWAACVVAHLQGLVNVILCAGKRDIRKCVLDTVSLLTCGYCGSEKDSGGEERRESTRLTNIGSSMISYLNRRRTTADSASPKPAPELHTTITSDIRAKSSIDKELGELGENWDEQPELKDRKQGDDRTGNEDEIQATPSHWGRRDSTEEVFRSILGEESDGELEDIRDEELATEQDEKQDKEEFTKQDEVQDPDPEQASCHHVTFRDRVSDVT